MEAWYCYYIYLCCACTFVKPLYFSSLLLTYLLLLLFHFSIIGLSAGTLCAFNVIIGDLGPSIIHNLFAVEVSDFPGTMILTQHIYQIELTINEL